MSAEFWLGKLLGLYVSSSSLNFFNHVCPISGNDILHALTSMEPMSLRIDLRLGNDTAYAHYSNFSVGSEVNHYAIDLSGYSGTAGNKSVENGIYTRKRWDVM